MKYVNVLVFLSIILSFNSHSTTHENFYINQRHKLSTAYEPVEERVKKSEQRVNVKKYRKKVLESHETGELIATQQRGVVLFEQVVHKIEVVPEGSGESSEEGEIPEVEWGEEEKAYEKERGEQIEEWRKSRQ